MVAFAHGMVIQASPELEYNDCMGIRVNIPSTRPRQSTACIDALRVFASVHHLLRMPVAQGILPGDDRIVLTQL